MAKAVLTNSNATDKIALEDRAACHLSGSEMQVSLVDVCDTGSRVPSLLACWPQ